MSFTADIYKEIQADIAKSSNVSAPQAMRKITEKNGIDIVFETEGRVVRVSKEDGEYLRLLPPPGNDTIYFKTVSEEKLRLVSHLSNEPGALAPEHYEIIKEK